MVEHSTKKTTPRKRTTAKKIVQAKPVLPQEESAGTYIEGIGGRKTATARVRLYPDRPSSFDVNKKTLEEYFQDPDLRSIALEPLQKFGLQGSVGIRVQVRGGGIRAQAEAVRHGTARALSEWRSEFREQLRSFGYITRDPRARERKKFGLRRARRARQWRKR